MGILDECYSQIFFFKVLIYVQKIFQLIYNF